MEKGGVAVGLATISVVLAALVFAAEKALTGPMQFIERYLAFRRTVATVRRKFCSP